MYLKMGGEGKKSVGGRGESEEMSKELREGGGGRVREER
jgi:hypothetical protein